MTSDSAVVVSKVVDPSVTTSGKTTVVSAVARFRVFVPEAVTPEGYMKNLRFGELFRTPNERLVMPEGRAMS